MGRQKEWVMSLSGVDALMGREKEWALSLDGVNGLIVVMVELLIIIVIWR
jgi:hypothetical protein